MAIETEGSERDRWQVMKVLYAEGRSFPEMLPTLADLGLIECKNEHRKRVNRDGATVCATCEMTVSQQWRRGLARLTETEADILEVKGAWIEAHEFIRDTCRKRCIKKGRSTTTRTTRTEKGNDGRDVDVVTEVTVTDPDRVDIGLLRLLSAVSDKLARSGGLDVDNPDAGERTPPVELHFHERDYDAEPQPN